MHKSKVIRLYLEAQWPHLGGVQTLNNMHWMPPVPIKSMLAFCLDTLYITKDSEIIHPPESAH